MTQQTDSRSIRMADKATYRAFDNFCEDSKKWGEVWDFRKTHSKKSEPLYDILWLVQQQRLLNSRTHHSDCKN